MTKKRALLLISTTAFALAPLGANAQVAAGPTDRADNDIVVTATRAAKTARAEEKAAPNLINVQSAEDIVKYPDFNAAEALGRVPGVSLDRHG